MNFLNAIAINHFNAQILSNVFSLNAIAINHFSAQILSNIFTGHWNNIIGGSLSD